MLRNTVLPVLAGALMLWTTQPAQAIVYLEEGGRVTVEAEFFSNRTTSGAGGLWTVKPGENSGTAIVDGGPIVSNFRGTGYVQTLPDALNPGGPNVDPLVEYQIQITNPGTYRLYVRWDGNNTNGTTRGQSDSLFVDIKEQKDGGGGAIADWYELTESVNGNFGSPAWDGGGGFEQNQAGASNNPMTWNLAAGTYTVRFSQREDGAAVDAFTLQDNSLAAPSGNGFNSSTVLNHNVSRTPTDDAFVRNGAANENDNFGSDGNLLVKQSGNNIFNRKSYLKFDVSDLDLDSIVDAALNLEVSVNNDGNSGPTPKAYTINFYGLNDGDAGEGWDEDTITAANAPANKTGNNNILGNASLLGWITVLEQHPKLENDPILVSFRNLDSSSLDAFVNFLRDDTDGLVTFILQRQAGLSNNFGFFSKEGDGLTPTLTLFSTNPPVPEPATGLLGLLCLAALARRRRAA